MACSPQALAGWLTPPGSLPPTPPAFSPLSPIPSDTDQSVVFGFPGAYVNPRHTVVPMQSPYGHYDEQHQQMHIGSPENGALSNVNLLMDRRWGMGPSPGAGINPLKQDIRQALMQQAAAGLRIRFSEIHLFLLSITNP